MKESIKERVDNYLTEMRGASEQDVLQVRERFASWYRTLSAEDQAQMRPFWQDVKQSAKAAIEEINNSLTELKALTEAKLVVGKYEYSLDEWITISDYSRRHNLKTSRVQNWITRGVIPPDKVVIVPQLNSLKLIKDEVYKSA
ncbi:hypothetical protein [Persicitalea jodogahamensis]|uniref:Helix-turn-helix domain-containing protein n=1 Tax=Persicitalea jodogahamensis TaxID=402147 RepID=A0A8J3D7W7_9BACT|nr:hypothetical protein [Persicitalea jodogahamensis]GHB64826.1 hypothetical protein GCM10007390_18560 [Persicitalea jodogahamensis]